ncbi:MAG: Mut7-C RNAse domain-containing protein, partial [Candidatus Bathyarchaeia archaeon]
VTRWLRLLGCDVAYVMDGSDEELLRISEAEGRTILTSDVQLYRRAVGKGLNAYLLKTRDSQAVRLAKLSKRFDIRLEVDVEQCRCPVCNRPLREAARADVEGLVPPTSLVMYDAFWACTNEACRKVYWQGSHWKKISLLLNEASHILSNMAREDDRDDR